MHSFLRFGLTFSILTLFLFDGFGQNFPKNLLSLSPDADYENIHVKALDKDSMACTYVIWVKESVSEHYHVEHTEVIYVLEGSGIMKIEDATMTLKAGDYALIPANARHSVKVISADPLKVLSIQTPYFDGSDRHFPEQ